MLFSLFLRCKITTQNTTYQEVTFISNSNLFLAFAENQRFARRKKSKKNWLERMFFFLIVGKLLTLLSKVSNHSRCINEIDNIRIIRYAKKRREKFDYRNLSRA
mgnify:CR=1 FL=1